MQLKISDLAHEKWNAKVPKSTFKKTYDMESTFRSLQMKTHTCLNAKPIFKLFADFS